MKKIYIVLLCLFSITSAYSTCVLYPVSLNNRVTNSSLIIEGTVISKQSFWNAANNYIYTANLVSVTQVIKGAVATNFIEIITEGGIVGTTRQVVEPALELEAGQKGVFMVNSFNQPAHFGFPVFQTYADEQGFIIFNSDGTACDPFKKYSSANGELKTDLQNELEITIPFFNAPNVPMNFAPPAVTSISPLIITAGTASQLTITGTAFGATQGTNTVLFKNADNGGATNITPHTSQYVSWSNTQIVVEVPSGTGLSGQAGTGQVTVSVGGVPNVSTQTLTIQYGHLNVDFTSTLTPQIFNTRHHGQNGAGGITWRMFTGFDAMAAPKADFLTTIAQWRCATFINWTVGATTTLNAIANDAINVVRFDIGAELPVGVLGRCSSYYNGCFAGPTMNWFVSELDICFDDAPPIVGGWQYGPGVVPLTQYDFASVSLHELGHGHQLSHVINPADVMHYALSNGQNNSVLNVDDIAGGVAVMARNTSGAVCGQTVMTALNGTNCALAPTASFNIVSPVCTNVLVPLNDLSTNTPTAWVWTMTGGTPPASASQNTSTSYSAPGIYTITLVATNASGSSAPFSQTISVVATPTVAASNATICSGTSTILTASGATSYTWNPGALVGATQTLSPPTTTVYTIIGSNGTCTSSISKTVTVNATPTVAVSNATICSGSSTVLTASGAVSYTWNPGGLTGATQTLSPPTTTVYTIIGSSGTCTSSINATVNVNATPTVATANGTICSGTSTVITASGAGSYTWNPGGLTGATQTLSPPTTTVYTIIGASGSCTSSISRTVTVNATPTVAASNATICAGSSTVLTASGATSYTWNPGALTGATQTLNPITTTTYVITGSNGTCSSTSSITINVNGTPTLSVGNATICSGTSTILTVSGATGYTWNPGALTGATQTLSPPTTTVYTIIGANGCTSSISNTVTVNATPTVAASNGTICSGSSTVITASGAVSYTWNPGALTGATQTLSPPTTTVYTIIGSSGTCTSSINTTVTVNATPTVAVSNATICSGSSTVLTASGAVSYTWNPGGLTGATQTLSPPTTTVYTIIGSSGTCTSSINATVNVNATPTVAVGNGTICSGTSTVITASGAVSYTWNPGGLTGATQTLSPPTTTVYTIIGANGSCTSSSSSTITVNATPTVAASNATLCNGSSTVLTASGAISYTWNPGGLTGATQTLSPPTTTVYTIIGSSGTCTSSINVTVNVSTTPTVAASNATICSGTSTVLTASGAITYTWNPGALAGATQTLSPPTTTVYTIIGANGSCTSSISRTVTVNATPTVAVSNATICSGSSTVITASGATSYTWNPGALTGATQTLSPPTTTVYTIIGSSGTCTSSVNATVNVNATPTVAAANGTICSGSSTVITASGAVSYTWNPGGLTGATQTLSPPTTTVYTIIGANGSCTSSTTNTVTVNATPTVAVSNATICSGSSTVLTASGAASFTWNPGALTGATQTLSPPTTTVYTIIGSSGTCTSSISRTVNVNPTPTVSAGNATICLGSSTIITASGATSYTWNPGGLTGATQTLSPVTTTTYIITGSNGSCTSNGSVVINVTGAPTVAVSNATICSGSSTVLTASGAASYTWNPGALTGATQTLSPGGTTAYTILGASGTCTTSTTNTITVNSSPTVNASGATICSGSSTVITASGATSYTWNPGALTGATQTLSPGGTTTYTITGSNGTCSGVTSIVLSVNPTPTISASNATICGGGSTVITASGAVSYTWNPGALTGATQTLNPVVTTTYNIIGATGSCSSNITITVNVAGVPTLAVSNATICSGSSTVITVSGAASYTWNPGALTGATQTLSPAVTTTYSILGANGSCTSSSTNTVTVNTSPTITVSSGSICSGNSTTLNANGGTSYTWNPGGLTGATQTLSPGSTTVYTVTGTNGSCTASSNGTLSVTATPTLSVNNATTCSGVTTTLTASGATSYTWNPGALAGSSQTFNPIITTTYTVTGDNGGCISSSSATIFIASTLSVGLAASDNTVCEGGTTTITATGANNYTFNPGGIFTNPAVFTPTTTTTYTVDGLSAGCAGNSVITITVVVCTGISTVNNGEEILLYPNPTEGLFNIKLTKPFSGKITVLNNIGQLIMTKDVNEKETIQLNLSDYAKGVYLIKLSSPKTYERFIKVIRD